MGRPAGWMKQLTGRSPMKSPGKPSLRRDVERLFWREVAKGLSSEDAAAAVGVSQAAGTRWFRDRGGMPTFLINPATGRYLSFEEREVIALLRAQGAGVREIARQIGRDPATVSRELRRHPWREARLPGFGGPVEGRVDGAAPQDGQARRQRTAPRLRPATTLRTGPSCRRDPGRRPGDGHLEGPEQAAPPGPPVGTGLEPSADLAPAQSGLPRRRVHAHLTRGHLPGAVRAEPRCTPT